MAACTLLPLLKRTEIEKIHLIYCIYLLRHNNHSPLSIVAHGGSFHPQSVILRHCKDRFSFVC